MILLPPSTGNKELDAYLYSLDISYNELLNGINLINSSVNAEKLSFKSKEVNTDYTVDIFDYSIVANATAGDITITLPDATSFLGRVFNIKKNDSTLNKVYIGGTIDDTLNSYIIRPFTSLMLQSDGTSWIII